MAALFLIGNRDSLALAYEILGIQWNRAPRQTAPGKINKLKKTHTNIKKSDPNIGKSSSNTEAVAGPEARKLRKSTKSRKTIQKSKNLQENKQSGRLVGGNSMPNLHLNILQRIC